jgi:hypothetical protein
MSLRRHRKQVFDRAHLDRIDAGLTAQERILHPVSRVSEADEELVAARK